MVQSLITPVDFESLGNDFEKIQKKFQKHFPQTEQEIQDALEKYPYPDERIGMRDADVETVKELFSDKQLAQLAYLK